MLGPILLCGNDPVLLRTREMVLSHAGFIVSVCTENDIASMPQEPAIALGVMGQSMPHKQQIETAERVRTKWPETKILFLRESDTSLAQLSAFEYECGSVDPARLIKACRAVLDSSTDSAAEFA